MESWRIWCASSPFPFAMALNKLNCCRCTNQLYHPGSPSPAVTTKVIVVNTSNHQKATNSWPHARKWATTIYLFLLHLRCYNVSKLNECITKSVITKKLGSYSVFLVLWLLQYYGQVVLIPLELRLWSEKHSKVWNCRWHKEYNYAMQSIGLHRRDMWQSWG